MQKIHHFVAGATHAPATAAACAQTSGTTLQYFDRDRDPNNSAARDDYITAIDAAYANGIRPG